jgi:hypothetical protein
VAGSRNSSSESIEDWLVPKRRRGANAVAPRSKKKSLRGAEAFIHGLMKNWVWGYGLDG